MTNQQNENKCYYHQVSLDQPSDGRRETAATLILLDNTDDVTSSSFTNRKNMFRVYYFRGLLLESLTAECEEKFLQSTLQDKIQQWSISGMYARWTEFDNSRPKKCLY